MNGRLLITCPDRHGIVAAVAGFLAGSGANITSSDQHSTDPEGGEFFMRMEFTLEHGDIGRSGARSRRRSRAARHGLAADRRRARRSA
jgi:formyltetrahydrofolate deformylase